MSIKNDIGELRFWCQKVIPLVYDDSLSYYELLCKVVQKLNETIDLANKLNEEWNDIQNTVVDLINEEVQKQIDNGTIGQMIKEATEDTYAKLEKEIADLTTSTTNKINGVQNNLDSYKQINDENVNNSYSYSDDARSTFNWNGKTLIIGDSYGEGYTPDGNVRSWTSILMQLLGSGNCATASKGGAGFSNTANSFTMLLEQLSGSFTNTDVRNIIVCGGYNDIDGYMNILSGMQTFFNRCKELFPNATVFVGMIGATTDSTKWAGLQNVVHEYAYNCFYYKTAVYLNGVENILHSDVLFSSDGVHPNSAGSIELGYYIKNALLGGGCTVSHPQYSADVEFYTNWGGTFECLTSQLNGVTEMILGAANITLAQTTNELKCDTTDYPFCKVSKVYMLGRNDYLTRINTFATVVADKYYILPCTIIYRGNSFSLQFNALNDSGTGYLTINNVTSIRFLQCRMNVNIYG